MDSDSVSEASSWLNDPDVRARRLLSFVQRCRKCNSDCDRTVIRQAQNLDEHRGLQTHTEESFWRANSLIAYALTSLGVARCRSRNSGFAFQACSFNHSDISPFRINDLRAVRRSDYPTSSAIAYLFDITCESNGLRAAHSASARKLCQTSKCLEITYGR